MKSNTYFYTANTSRSYAPIFPENYPTFDFSDLDKTPTIKDMEKYFYNFKNYKAIFPIEILDKALSILTLRDITTFDYIPQSDMKYYINKEFPVLSKNPSTRTLVEHNGPWKHEFSGYTYTVLQGNKYNFFEKEYIFKCLELMFPWFSSFRWDIYHLDSENSDIYLKVDKKESVYVPVKAIINKDINAIIKHHIDYFTEYYCWPGGWGKGVTEADVLGWRAKYLSYIDSKEFKRFSNCMNL